MRPNEIRNREGAGHDIMQGTEDRVLIREGHWNKGAGSEES